jgi:hypothetical protein
MPAYYQQPRTLDDLADFMAGKILGALGFDHDLYPPWTGQAEPGRRRETGAAEEAGGRPRPGSVRPT